MVQHLVVDDELHEVAGNPASIEVGVDANEPLDRAVASELDGGARLLTTRPRASVAPRDERVDRASEVLGVDVVKDGKKIVVLALGVRELASPGASP